MSSTTEKKPDEPVMGIPYNPNYQQQPSMYAPQQPQPQYYVGHNPYQSGQIPPNAVFGDPKGIPIQQTIYRDTPAPVNCAFCGSSGLTTVRSKPSLAAAVGCMMPFMLGVCFLCPSMDCLWHKYHYCPHCNEKLADFEKNDACLVMDPPRWSEPSFALPA
ncbi:GSH-induced LITAF domain protein-like [Bidens hawaiensis]|uniref:GSH-induced LITAF domain protein-like n=1 Tax=Bidens hawaiensis TaxID=980011 RepID=UPI004049497F